MSHVSSETKEDTQIEKKKKREKKQNKTMSLFHEDAGDLLRTGSLTKQPFFGNTCTAKLTFSGYLPDPRGKNKNWQTNFSH